MFMNKRQATQLSNMASHDATCERIKKYLSEFDGISSKTHSRAVRAAHVAELYKFLLSNDGKAFIATYPNFMRTAYQKTIEILEYEQISDDLLNTMHEFQRVCVRIMRETSGKVQTKVNPTAEVTC